MIKALVYDTFAILNLPLRAIGGVGSILLKFLQNFELLLPCLSEEFIEAGE